MSSLPLLVLILTSFCVAEEITASFRRFGPLVVDWPHKAESKSYFPPKGEVLVCPSDQMLMQWVTGYAFLLFQEECSVQALIDACINEDDKLYLCVSSPTIKDKPVTRSTLPPITLTTTRVQVQIRPWRLSDADFVLDASMPLDPRKTVFVGGVPRPLKAGQSLVLPEGRARTQSSFPACSRVGDDYGSLVWRRLLCWYRHGSRTQVPERRGSSRVLEPAELHRSHQRALRPAATRRHRKEGESW